MKTTTMTPNHPECLDREIFLGNFTHKDAQKIGWKTKRPGNKAFCADGRPYQYQQEHGVRPYFVMRSELDAAGVKTQG